MNNNMNRRRNSSQNFVMKKYFNIYVKYLSNKIDELEFIDGKSDWIDLRAAEDISLSAGEFTLIPLGVAIKIPEGYEAHLVPRSSTFKNYGIIQTNGIGIIDNSYCGNDDEWKMPVYATRDCYIAANSRIAQFRIFENQPPINLNKVDNLEDSNRGGFGSTGV